MSERLETKRCIKSLYKYSSFPFFPSLTVQTLHWIVTLHNASHLKHCQWRDQLMKCMLQWYILCDVSQCEWQELYISSGKTSSDARQAASGNTHSQCPDKQSVDETTAVSRIPLQSCVNTRNDGLLFSSPELPVLSNLAQQCLRSGLKH